MKWKQILLVIAISAVSAVGSVIVYGKLTNKQKTSFSQATQGDLPVNYAGYFDGGNVFVNNNLGIGEPEPDADIDIASSQSVLQMNSYNHASGSVIELRNSTSSPTLFNSKWNFQCAAKQFGC